VKLVNIPVQLGATFLHIPPNWYRLVATSKEQVLTSSVDHPQRYIWFTWQLSNISCVS